MLWPRILEVLLVWFLQSNSLSVGPRALQRSRRMAFFSSADSSGLPTSLTASPKWSKFCDPVRIANAKQFPKERLGLTFTNILTHQPRIKCYVLSDLHADAEKNQIWVRENCLRLKEDQDVFTVFILPGDIGSEIDRLQSVFNVLVSNYDAVVYCPGNHEAWRRGTASGGSATQPHLRADNRMAVDSIEKIIEVVECAKACGVYVGPVRIERDSTKDLNDDSTAVTVFPLYSWYHAGWDTEPDLDNDMVQAVEEVMPFHKKWGDFSMCSWPEELLSLSHAEWATTDTSNDNTVLAEAFAAINEPFLVPPVSSECAVATEASAADKRRGICALPSVKESDTIISFSHFLPRQELCPEKRFLIEPLLSRVVGSDPLEAQVRRLNPHLHLFGHTHIPIDLELEGIRYLQWPLGYSREAHLQCAPVHSVGPLMVYDSACGTGKAAIPARLPSLSTVWTKYYATNRRDPTNGNLAPWVVQRLDSFSGLVRSSRSSVAGAQSTTTKH